MMLRAARGFIISTEALVLSLLISLLLVFAFMFAANYLNAMPKLSQTTIDAKLCGAVLTIRNAGSVTAYMHHVYAVDSTGRLYDVSSLIPQDILRPGDEVTAVLNDTYTKVIIVGENFNTVVETNECIG